MDGTAGRNILRRAKSTDVAPGKDFYVNFKVQVPEHIQYNKPSEHRNDPEKDSIYTVDVPQYQTLPFPPLGLRAHVTYPLVTIEASSVGRVQGTTGPAMFTAESKFLHR